MVRENRIKFVNFPLGSLTANADGLFSVYSREDPNGFLKSIQILSNTFGANGSLFLIKSGTEEVLWRKEGSAGVSGITHPKVRSVDDVNLTISGGNGYVDFSDITLFGKLRLIGSGLGNGTSGLGINIEYI